jgi:type IV pilus assembly protein PilX
MSARLASSGCRMPTRPAQRGVVMWVALVVLIVMTLAGLAMLRQMGSGVSIAGNIAFKENATSSADAGTEVGRQWLVAQTTVTLNNDLPASGYYATWGASIDPTTFDWSNAGSVPVALEAGNGNDVRYIVHRLCQAVGPADTPFPAQRCSDVQDDVGGSRGGAGYGTAPPTEVIRPYFRVTVRVIGPRQTVSYTQVVLS